MPEFFGREYNFEAWQPWTGEFEHFRTIVHAGDPAPDFTLRDLDGEDVTLSRLRGKPVMIEFGSIT